MRRSNVAGSSWVSDRAVYGKPLLALALVVCAALGCGSEKRMTVRLTDLGVRLKVAAKEPTTMGAMEAAYSALLQWYGGDRRGQRFFLHQAVMAEDVERPLVVALKQSGYRVFLNANRGEAQRRDHDLHIKHIERTYYPGYPGTEKEGGVTVWQCVWETDPEVPLAGADGCMWVMYSEADKEWRLLYLLQTGMG